MIQQINVDDAIKILQQQKPKRWNKDNKETLFNDPRLTDFLYINFKSFWDTLRVLKQTKVKHCQLIVNHVDNEIKLVNCKFNGPQWQITLYGVTSNDL